MMGRSSRSSRPRFDDCSLEAGLRLGRKGSNDGRKGQKDKRTGIATPATFRWAADVYNPNPLIAKRFGSPRNAWARWITRPRGRMFEFAPRHDPRPACGCLACRSVRKGGTELRLQCLFFPVGRSLEGEQGKPIRAVELARAFISEPAVAGGNGGRAIRDR